MNFKNAKCDYTASLPELRDSWRYVYTSPIPEPQGDPNKPCVNSELDQITHDFANPQRSPWLCLASIEKSYPHELDNLSIVTDLQKDYIRLHHFEGQTLQEIADEYGVSNQSVSQCLDRAKRQIDTHRDLVHEIMNASQGVGKSCKDKRADFF